MRYHLAVDIGASSGRLMLGWHENGAMQTEEIHRFENSMMERDGQLCWDVDIMFAEILTGMKKCAAINKTPCSIGIDTWGVDFVLLDGAGKRLGNAVAYRDHRTAGMIEKVHQIIPEDELFEATGVLSQVHNSIFQLMAVQQQQPELLNHAAHFLMLPDYFHYRLSGVMVNEYTEATTSGLVNAITRDWDKPTINRLGINGDIFKKIVPPGTIIGRLAPEIQKEVGYDCDVICPAGHDTASAVAAAAKGAIYISSGTWSLVGITADAPNLSCEGRMAGFTNEGGYGGVYRYCKNSMGLFMMQCVRRELDNAYSYAELCELAEQADIASIVNSDDMRFFSPKNMIAEVQNACAESGRPIPRTPGELAKVVYQSLAASYARTAEALEKLMGRTYDAINIIGGGSKADYLNRLTALKTGKKIIAGPVEATALGNLTAQHEAYEGDNNRYEA